MTLVEEDKEDFIQGGNRNHYKGVLQGGRETEFAFQYGLDSGHL